MSAKPAASSDGIELSSVIAVLKARALILLLTGAAVGGLTFFALSLKAPQLSIMLAVGWILLGAAWIVTRALFHRARSGGVRKASRGAPANVRPSPRSEPALAGGEKISANDGAQAPAVLLATIEGLAHRIDAQRPADGGHRTLITGEAGSSDAPLEAVELANALYRKGSQVILVDWSPLGRGLDRAVGVRRGAGITDMIVGGANFDDAVSRAPDGSFHFIGRDGRTYASDGVPDPDHINLILDALDEAYDHIVVAGPHDDALALFEAIQGRFDAGVIVGEANSARRSIDAPGMFLGFEVAEIDVMRFERRSTTGNISQQRIARASGAARGR
jgi:succinoglycan biosynthesis transport protein ExoP